VTPPKRFAALLVGAFACSFAAPSGADVADRLPRIAKLRDAAIHAEGPYAYVALRRIWGEWDRGDPADVEEALAEVEADSSVSAPARTYASLLSAYARRRRGDLDGARQRIARLGYVSRWSLAGPFDNEGKGGLDTPYEPERDQSLPIDTTRSMDGKEHHPVKWRAAPDVSPYGWLDFGSFLRPVENVCAYAVTFVRDDRIKDKQPARTVSVWAASAGAMRVWWNGSPILKDDKYRDLDYDRFAAEVTLRPGWNRVLVKVCGDSDAPMVSLRIGGANGGPDAHLEVDGDPSRSTRSGGAVEQLGKGVAPGPAARTLFGALEGFERRVQGGDPAALEAFARYLTLTSSDDPADHRARELATKAAEKAPTIERLLLAGEVAEDRNQRGPWIEKAEALRDKGGASQEERIAVLLARANQARTGPNWRDAMPYYERVLGLDPDDVVATLARVELYDQAGLHETAVSLLEHALARRPKSVALLRAMVATLREQSRTTDAAEMAERYAALRFDDPSFARSHIELALARRDAVSAERWVDRLVATNPDNSAGLYTAARSYTALGDRARAIATYLKILDLAPEDVDTMKELADVYALGGQRDQQFSLLKRVLELRPQAKDVRDYLAHSEKVKPKDDEVYARPPAEFLKNRDAPANGHSRRTLVDLQVTTVFENGLASRFHQVVYQPLNDAEAASGRGYAFGFEADSETVQLRGAKVYRKDGSIEDAVESGEESADDPSVATYTSQHVFYVHFPRLNPGDVVELQYRIEDVAYRNAFADYFGEVEYMQSNEPIARAEYVLITPKSRSFYFNQPNVPGLARTVDEKGNQRAYHFVAENVPPVDPEPSQPPYPEILGHVHVSTYKSWDEMGKWYWGLVHDQFTPDDEVRRRVAEITKGLKDDRAKVRAVYDYVVQKTRYVALEFGIHGYKPYRCSQIFARGFGDCKDKATLIVTMLKEAGIPATIVIVRTGMRGLFDTEPASLAPFDHAIAYVPSMDLYLDGTAEYTGSTELPSMDRGAMALQINEGSPKLVHLPDAPASDSVTSQKVDVAIAADGSAQIDWHIGATGVDASRWRVQFHADATRKQKMQELMASQLVGATLKSVEAGNLEDVEQPVSLHAKGEATQFARKEGEDLSIPAGPREYLVRDFASLSARRLDLRMHAKWTLDQDWHIKLPPGTKVNSSTVGGDATSAFGSAKVEVESSPGAIHVHTIITMNTTRVSVADYPAFRAWCADADRLLGQRVLVGK
jgi:transglutaminase-like putative cysteine protease/lipopolysaccharide biosynthesis regulator YciM